MAFNSGRERQGTLTASAIADDTLIELVYDPDKRSTALAVSQRGGSWSIEREVRIGPTETLIPYPAKNNLIASGCVLLPSKPEPHGNKQQLLKDIETFVHRYLDVTAAFEQIASHYILLSWVHDAFNEVPYLRLQGEYGTGKTRALLVIGSLCYRPIFASGASTVSPIFHILDRFGGTLILDEADFRLSDSASEVVKILNNGHMKGLPVLRSVQTRDKEFDPRAFRVFGPKLVGMRGRFEDQALDSRFITEKTGAHPMRSDVPITLPAGFRVEALALRNRLLHYRFCEVRSVVPRLEVLLNNVEPRVNQIALPLLSIVDDPLVRTEIEFRLVQDHGARIAARRASLEARLLGLLRDTIRESNTAPVSIGALAGRFNADYGAELHQPVSGKWVGHIVRKVFNVRTTKSDGVYVVPVTEWQKIEALAARQLDDPTKDLLDPSHRSE